jgi:hypothetical protein
VRKVEISAKHEKRSPRGSKNTHRDERARGVPALGERRDEKRGGNDAAPTAGLYQLQRIKNEAETKFQLTH